MTLGVCIYKSYERSMRTLMKITSVIRLSSLNIVFIIIIIITIIVVPNYLLTLIPVHWPNM